jgi:hypothetical protein
VAVFVIQFAVAAALSVTGLIRAGPQRPPCCLVAGTVWLWGAAVFVIWFVLGDRVPQ